MAQPIHFELTKEEFIRAHRIHLRRSLLSPKNLVFLTLALGLASLQAQLFGPAAWTGQVFLGLWIVIVLGMFLAWLILPARLAARTPEGRQSWGLGDSALEIGAHGTSRRSFDWSDLKKISESRDFFFLHFAPEGSLPRFFPKRAAPGSVEEFREVLAKILTAPSR